jgi:MMPL family
LAGGPVVQGWLRVPGITVAAAMTAAPWSVRRLAGRLGACHAALYRVAVQEWAGEWSLVDNHASVAAGLAATARVISCAALIMASVFLSFLLSTNVVVKMLALGLGVSVLIDASVIRLVVVPASMFLLGRLNWWMPGWLDRVLPHLEPERRVAASLGQFEST